MPLDKPQNDSAQGLVMTGASADEVWPLVRDFHYSRRMPGIPLFCFAWRREGGLFGDTGEPVAAAIFGKSANNKWPQDALELQRLVRRDDFALPLSSFVSWSLRWLRANTETPFAFSYADTGQSHHGGIYQASGWNYVNLSRGDRAFMDEAGNYRHGRGVYSKYGTRSADSILRIHPNWKVVRDSDKHVYIFPLRRKWSVLSRLNGWRRLPYPKPNAARLLDDQGSPLNEAGANPAGRSNTTQAAA